MKILIVGAGWVGQYLVKHWLKEGHAIQLTARSSSSLSQWKGVLQACFQVDFDTPDVVWPVELDREVDLVIISVPLGTNSELAHFRTAQLVKNLSLLKSKTAIYLSSVGIYPDLNGTMSEDGFLPEGADLVRSHAEQAISSCFATHYTLRLGGLFGLDRIFARYFVNKICYTGDQPSNFIHVEDVRRCIEQLSVSNLPSGIFNLVCPEHPSKREVILASANKYQLPLPNQFISRDSAQKIVSPDKLIQALNFEYHYSNPLNF